MTVAEREERNERLRGTQQSHVQNVCAYQTPGILAAFKGRPVKLIATGDMPGHSPVGQFIDEDGRIGWDDLDRFTIVDSQYLPPSKETLTEVFRSLNR